MTEVENDAVPSETLQKLARACGVATDVHLIDGTHVRCSRAAILAALEAMGIRADTDEACRESLHELEDYVWKRIVPPVTVIRQGQTRDIPIHVPDGSPVTASLRFEFGGDVPLEQADIYTAPHDVGGALVGRAMFRLAKRPPPRMARRRGEVPLEAGPRLRGRDARGASVAASSGRA